MGPRHGLLRLLPFPGLSAPAGELSAQWRILPAIDSISTESLEVTFLWSSPSTTEFIEIPDCIDRSPARHDRLWERTCFEVFFREHGKSNYWELNVAPRGDWNLYSFTSYREGMRTETRVSRLPVLSQISSSKAVTQFVVPLSSLGLDPIGLEYSWTAVIVGHTVPLSYWATRHCGTEPDFHHSDSLGPAIS